MNSKDTYKIDEIYEAMREYKAYVRKNDVNLTEDDIIVEVKNIMKYRSDKFLNTFKFELNRVQKMIVALLYLTTSNSEDEYSTYDEFYEKRETFVRRSSGFIFRYLNTLNIKINYYKLKSILIEMVNKFILVSHNCPDAKKRVFMFNNEYVCANNYIAAGNPFEYDEYGQIWEFENIYGDKPYISSTPIHPEDPMNNIIKKCSTCGTNIIINNGAFKYNGKIIKYKNLLETRSIIENITYEGYDEEDIRMRKFNSLRKTIKRHFNSSEAFKHTGMCNVCFSINKQRKSSVGSIVDDLLDLDMPENEDNDIDGGVDLEGVRRQPRRVNGNRLEDRLRQEEEEAVRDRIELDGGIRFMDQEDMMRRQRQLEEQRLALRRAFDALGEENDI